jgi:3-hydroxyisobutyrate dehydrogenase-like beta-hydroxyacid dehydrogenase
MGAALAACLDGDVVWASEGRSAATASRAAKAEISDLGSLESVLESADAVISVCPPGAAVDVAEEVGRLGFDRLYVDVNAVSPATSRHIGSLFDRFVDGGIVGPPPVSLRASDEDHSGTRLYLSGEEALDVAALFAGSAVDSHVIGSTPGQASALKMAYAAWTKGSSALLLSVAALATSEGVIEELLAEWDNSIPELRTRLEWAAARVGAKAWRFVGEMEEIALSHRDAGLPNGFHLAAADIYSRLADLKDHPPGQTPDEILNMILGKSASDSVGDGTQPTTSD